MAHDCPECGQLCYCGGDIDDCCLNDEDSVNACTHCETSPDHENDAPEGFEAIRAIKQRQFDYLRAVEPIARERAKLAMMFARCTLFPGTGEVRREYSPEVQALDDQYVALTKLLQLRFLGTADGAGEGRPYLQPTAPWLGFCSTGAERKECTSGL